VPFISQIGNDSGLKGKVLFAQIILNLPYDVHPKNSDLNESKLKMVVIKISFKMFVFVVDKNRRLHGSEIILNPRRYRLNKVHEQADGIEVEN